MTVKIKTVADAKQVANDCIGQLVTDQRLVYFSLLVSDLEGNVTNCYFSPTAPIYPKIGGIVEKKSIFVNDIGKLLRMLLSHPKITNLKYDPKENVISACFQDEAESTEEE